jgi:CDP-ribitol ribitolphosphotransferase
LPTPLPGATFVVAGRELTVAPRLDPVAERLTLDVGLRIVRELEPASVRIRAFIDRARRLLRAALFRLLLAAARRVSPRNGRRVLFTSNSRPVLGGNLRIVHDRMVERGFGERFELLGLFKPRPTARRSLRDMIRLPWLLGRADVVLIDDYHPAVYALHDPAVRVVQLWHAYGAFKTFDYSRVGKPGAPDPWGRDHKNYWLVPVGAPTDVRCYAEAFGVDEDRIRATGVPRMDEFVARAGEPGIRDRALARFPEAARRRTILFAPTFRGSGGRSATYPVDALDFRALHAVCRETDSVFIVRLHPHVRQRPAIPAELRDRILEDCAASTDAPDLLYGADVLVTDYSSIVFEYAALHRPMLFYAFDLEEYRATRDFYVDYESFVPGRIVRTFDDLVAAIRADDYQAAKVAPFAARFLPFVDGMSADRIIDLIVSQ